MRAVTRAIVRMNTTPLVQLTPHYTCTVLTAAKLAAKLGLLWLLYTYVSCMVDIVGGDTLQAVRAGKTPPHRLGTTPEEARRMRDIPQDIMRVMDALSVAAKRRTTG